MRVIFAGILCLANLAVLVTAAGAEDYRGEFLSTVVASEGGGGMVGPVHGTWRRFVLEEEGVVEIDASGHLSASISGLRRADDIFTYEEIFASLVCGKKIVANSELFARSASGDISIRQEGFVSPSEITTEKCPQPIVLFRRNGCTEISGCSKDDPSNKRWLAKSTARLCAGTTFGSDDLFRSGIGASTGGVKRMAGIHSSSRAFRIDDGGIVEIDSDGNFSAEFSGLERTDGVETYEKIVASFVCANRIIKSTAPAAATGIDASVEIYEERFLTAEDLAGCLAPVVLFRRSGGSDRWLAASGFNTFTGGVE